MQNKVAGLVKLVKLKKEEMCSALYFIKAEKSDCIDRLYLAAEARSKADWLLWTHFFSMEKRNTSNLLRKDTMKKNTNKSLEKVAAKFTALMIKRIAEIEDDWTKPWFPVKHKNFVPQNITGRAYSGGNTLMLLIYLTFTDYRTPVFLTFKQATERGLHILKGSQSFVVYHFLYLYQHKDTKERIDVTEYDKLSDSEKDDYRIIPIMKCFDVFNLDQTNFSEIYPEEWAMMQTKFAEKVQLNTSEMFTYPSIDQMLEFQQWVCPIYTKLSNRAYYMLTEDKIILPLKTQFKSGEEFYTTMLHEMAHSTGATTRLNRKLSNSSDRIGYAKEELVAELTSALVAYYIGIESSLRDDHAAYLKYWIKKMREEPNYLMEVLSDTVKATQFICKHLHLEPFGEKPTAKKESRVEYEELTIVD